MTKFSLNRYKQQIRNDFNSRSNYESEFHRKAAARLVELAKLQAGQRVLDVATGTGLAAIAAARVVGLTGHVLGTDFSAGMLQQARAQAEALGLKNIVFENVDADNQELQERQYDIVLCSSAIVYFTDIPAVLEQWHSALRSEGRVVFSCLAETSPSASVVFRSVVKKYGITIPNPNALLGTPEKCRQILEAAGFEGTEMVPEQFGSYLQDASAVWAGNARSAFGLQDAQWSEEQLNQCRLEYLAEIKKVSTEDGYWNDVTLFFVTAHKARGA
ncbi:class I SAM-dependent methyltransferase [Acaryochloris thomasi]|nr:methyltransferase domain-containing protein [Acaryochloris thomasi]